MKVVVTFKTPDALAQAVRDIVDQQHHEDSQTWDEYEAEEREHELMKKFERWVAWGEVITIEFDLEAGTATVKERG